MKPITCALAVLIGLGLLLPGLMYGDMADNGKIKLFTVGNNVLTIMLNSEKRMLTYRIAATPASIALKGVRTWHYDAQMARTLTTLSLDGTYPNKKIDNDMHPQKVIEWMKKHDYKPSLTPKVGGLGQAAAKGGSSGGTLSVTFEVSRTESLLVLLDAENYALLLYRIKERGIEFLACRSILLDVQIPAVFPAETPNSPLKIRAKLKAIKEDLDKKYKRGYPKGAIPFEWDDAPGLIPEDDAAEDDRVETEETDKKEEVAADKAGGDASTPEPEKEEEKPAMSGAAVTEVVEPPA
jgi:hypothetical protein